MTINTAGDTRQPPPCLLCPGLARMGADDEDESEDEDFEAGGAELEEADDDDDDDSGDSDVEVRPSATGVPASVLTAGRRQKWQRCEGSSSFVAGVLAVLLQYWQQLQLLHGQPSCA